MDLPNISASSLNAIAANFEVSNEQLLSITDHLVQSFSDGLKAPGRPVAMAPTFVTKVPTGKEEGTILTLGMHLTTFRVSQVTLHDSHYHCSQKDKLFSLSKAQLSGSAEALFDFFANSVAEFLAEYGNDFTSTIPVGFTFPFPLDKTGIGSGKLISWAKGVSIKDGQGQNVEKMLNDAFERKGIDAKCVAIINDTVACILAESYTFPSLTSCAMSAIFGIGTNGAIFEDVSKIQKLSSPPGGKMLINTEWGAFNDTKVLPRTVFDETVDKQSARPGFHLFEKLISWLFIGEITRHILLTLTERVSPVLFSGNVPAQLREAHGLDTRDLSMIEQSASVDDIKKLLGDTLRIPVSNDDATIVKWVCKLVSDRACKLAASAIAAGLIHQGLAKFGGGSTGSDKILIAAGGEMILFYPEFESRLRQNLAKVIGANVEQRVQFLSVKDADALGAALAALQAI